MTDEEKMAYKNENKMIYKENEYKNKGYRQMTNDEEKKIKIEKENKKIENKKIENKKIENKNKEINLFYENIKKIIKSKKYESYYTEYYLYKIKKVIMKYNLSYNDLKNFNDLLNDELLKKIKVYINNYNDEKMKNNKIYIYFFYNNLSNENYKDFKKKLENDNENNEKLNDFLIQMYNQDEYNNDTKRTKINDIYKIIFDKNIKK